MYLLIGLGVKKVPTLDILDVLFTPLVHFCVRNECNDQIKFRILDYLMKVLLLNDN